MKTVLGPGASPVLVTTADACNAPSVEINSNPIRREEMKDTVGCLWKNFIMVLDLKSRTKELSKT